MSGGCISSAQLDDTCAVRMGCGWGKEAREEDTEELKWGYLGTPGWVVRVSPWVCVKRSASC